MGTPPSRRARRWVAPLLVGAAIAALPSPAAALEDPPLWPWEVVSRAGGDAPPSDGYSVNAELSDDGRYVLFTSDDRELDPAAGERAINNVFRKDMETGELVLVSRRGLTGPGADDTSHAGSMSADGRYVAFGSHATNLGPENEPDWYDAYLKDLVTGAIRLLSPSRAEGRTDGYWGTGAPRISADGRFAAIGVGDRGGGPNGVYRRDLQSGELELASQPTGSSWRRSEVAGPAYISDDGRYIAFSTDASLAPEDAGDRGKTDVYLRDLETDTTTLVTTDEHDLYGGGRVTSMSADGSRVAYIRQLDDGDDHAFVWDRSTGTNELVDRIGRFGPVGDGDTENAKLAPDGRRILLMSFSRTFGLDVDDFSDVFLRDLETGLMQNISFLVPGPGRWHAGEGDISADNRYAVFSGGDDYLSLEDDDDASADTYRRRLIQFPPLCVPAVAAVERDGSATVALRCRDLDGDAIEIEIVEGPEHGTLGQVDQEGGTVRYTPTPGYTGPDSFTFRAADGAEAGNEAVAILAVHAPLPPAGPDPTPDPSPDGGDPPSAGPNPPSAGPDPSGAAPSPPSAAQPPAPFVPVGAPELMPTPAPAAGASAPFGPCSIEVLGSPAAELLLGGAGGDRLRGFGGNDRLRAGRGDDCLEGGAGGDALKGGDGDDRLVGGPGRDSYRAGSGADRVKARDGVAETVDCGPGRDVATVDRSDRLRGCERAKRPRRR